MLYALKILHYWTVVISTHYAVCCSLHYWTVVISTHYAVCCSLHYWTVVISTHYAVCCSLHYWTVVISTHYAVCCSLHYWTVVISTHAVCCSLHYWTVVISTHFCIKLPHSCIDDNFHDMLQSKMTLHSYIIQKWLYTFLQLCLRLFSMTANSMFDSWDAWKK